MSCRKESIIYALLGLLVGFWFELSPIFIVVIGIFGWIIGLDRRIRIVERRGRR